MSMEYSGYWTFICNPKKWNVEKALKDMKNGKSSTIDSWTINDYMINQFQVGQYGIIRVGIDKRAKKNLKPGETKLKSGVYALVKVISYSKIKDKEYGYDLEYNLDNDSSYLKAKYYVELEYIKNLIDNPILISDLRENKIINRDPFFVKGYQGRAVPIQTEAFEEILKFMDSDVSSFSSFEDNEYIRATESLRNTKIRIGQSKFRDSLLEKSKSCQLCGLDNIQLLIASHIKPWAYSTSKERLDSNNGLLLCPNHDALFDKGLISFDRNGEIIISDDIVEEDYDLLNINPKNTVSNISTKGSSYLKWHRNFYKEKL